MVEIDRRGLRPACGEDTGLDAVVLSGGVFLNALLTREVDRAARRADGFRVYRHRRVPPNDGGLSLGQLAVAAARTADDATARGEEPTMCLGIPGKVVETYREHDVLMGKVDFGGVFKRVCLEHVPEVQTGRVRPGPRRLRPVADRRGRGAAGSSRSSKR